MAGQPALPCEPAERWSAVLAILAACRHERVISLSDLDPKQTGMRRRRLACISLPLHTGSSPKLGIGTLLAEFFAEHMLLTLIRGPVWHAAVPDQARRARMR